MNGLDNFLMIAHDMGILVEVMSFASIVPFIVLLVFHEWDLIIAMGSTPLCFLIIGVLLAHLPNKEESYSPKLSVAMMAVALTWFVIAIIGGLPFMIGMHMSFTDSVFEAMSGWTTTGFTMMTNLDNAPRTMIFWRSYLQWMGGIGVISFGIAMISHSTLFQVKLFRSEGRTEMLMPNVIATGRRILAAYVAVTIVFIVLVKVLASVPLWDAANLVMVAISTGGFPINDAMFSYYNNIPLEALLCIVMFTGSLPIQFCFFLYQRKFLRVFKDSIFKVTLCLAFFGSLFTSYELYRLNHLPLLTALREGIFCAISGLTTTGLQNSNPHYWAAAPIVIVSVLMVIGGAIGSTAGGIKVNRLILAYEGLVWWFKRYFARPSMVIPFRHEGKNIAKNIAETELSINILIILLYFLSLFGAYILVLNFPVAPFQTHEIFFELVSALSNCGLGLGYITVASPLPVKWIFIILMWIGRVEFIPVFILFLGIIEGLKPTIIIKQRK